jgi:hypothetical protein
MQRKNRVKYILVALLLPLLSLFVTETAIGATRTNNGISVNNLLPNAVGGVWYDYDIAASAGLSGGTGGAPYSFKVVGGQLPVGFSLSERGVLHGVNCFVRNGEFKVSLAITSSGGTVGTFAGADSFGIEMTSIPNSGLCAVSLAVATPTATVGVPYSTTIIASGGVSPYKAPTLPTGGI